MEGGSCSVYKYCRTHSTILPLRDEVPWQPREVPDILVPCSRHRPGGSTVGIFFQCDRDGCEKVIHAVLSLLGLGPPVPPLRGRYIAPCTSIPGGTQRISNSPFGGRESRAVGPTLILVKLDSWVSRSELSLPGRSSE